MNWLLAAVERNSRDRVARNFPMFLVSALVLNRELAF